MDNIRTNILKLKDKYKNYYIETKSYYDTCRVYIPKHRYIDNIICYILSNINREKDYIQNYLLKNIDSYIENPNRWYNNNSSCDNALYYLNEVHKYDYITYNEFINNLNNLLTGDYIFNDLTQQEIDHMIPSNTVLLAITGSIAYGTNIQYDDSKFNDVDIRGVCIGDVKNYLGLNNFEQRRTTLKQYDSVIYEIKKFFSLLIKQNPSILELLWLDEYISTNEIGNKIIENRDLFLSKECYRTFTGYAYGSMKKLEPLKYHRDMGAKRKALVDKHGIDVVEASHLIRLLRMAIDILKNGKVVVKRPDADELRDIKQGKWKIEDIKQLAEELFKEAEVAKNKSKLPDKVDFNKANDLLVEILSEEIVKYDWL